MQEGEGWYRRVQEPAELCRMVSEGAAVCRRVRESSGGCSRVREVREGTGASNATCTGRSGSCLRVYVHDESKIKLLYVFASVGASDVLHDRRWAGAALLVEGRIRRGCGSFTAALTAVEVSDCGGTQTISTTPRLRLTRNFSGKAVRLPS